MRKIPEPAHYAAILSAVLLTACGDGTDLQEQFADADSAIVNGSNNSGDPAVVALTAFGQAFCTGTLIRPNVVLTAAHCLPPNISEFGINSYAEIEVFFGSVVGAGGTMVRAVDGWTHPGWNINVFEDDIGLLRLGAAGPATPIPFATEPMTNGDVGASTRLVGFGITSDGNSDSGIKRQGTTTIAEVFQFVFTMGLAPSGTCNGDSGGPTFMNRGGGEAVVGVHSRSDCASQAIDTRVDGYTDDITTFIGELPDGPQCFADGQCATECGAPDPDCPCAADGFCTDACDDPSTDVDCTPDCNTNGVCNPDCAPGLDADCGSVDPENPVGDDGGSWLAGQADDSDYDGTIVESCAHAPGPGRSTGWPLFAALAFLVRRRRA